MLHYFEEAGMECQTLVQNSPPVVECVEESPPVGIVLNSPQVRVVGLLGVVEDSLLENIVDSPLVDIVVHNLLVSIVEVVIGNRILEKARMGGHPLLMGRN